MKNFIRSLVSLRGVITTLTGLVGAFGTFGISLAIESVPPIGSAIVFVVAFIIGFLYGSFGADKQSELETKKAEIAAKADVERAYETERARVEAEAEVKRRNLADAAEAQRQEKKQRENDLFRALIKSLDFSSKVLLWRIYSDGEYKVKSGACLPEICDMLDELCDAEYIETETVDFGVTAYRVTDETKGLIGGNEDLFRNAKEKCENDLIRRLF